MRFFRVRVDEAERGDGEPLVYASPCVGYVEVAKGEEEREGGSPEEVLESGYEGARLCCRGRCEAGELDICSRKYWAGLREKEPLDWGSRYAGEPQGWMGHYVEGRLRTV